jgi:AbrB family looped-hinge helix DNA binding protein
VSIVGERGQVTIDKAIREELGIRAGDEAVQRVEDGRIVIEVVPGRHRRSLFGVHAQAGGARSGATPDRAAVDRAAADGGEATTDR